MLWFTMDTETLRELSGFSYSLCVLTSSVCCVWAAQRISGACRLELKPVKVTLYLYDRLRLSSSLQSVSELKSNPLDLLKLFTPVDWQLSAACWFTQWAEKDSVSLISLLWYDKMRIVCFWLSYVLKNNTNFNFGVSLCYVFNCGNC